MRQYSIKEINNGWLFEFHNDNGYQSYYFTTLEELTAMLGNTLFITSQVPLTNGPYRPTKEG